MNISSLFTSRTRSRVRSHAGNHYRPSFHASGWEVMEPRLMLDGGGAACAQVGHGGNDSGSHDRSDDGGANSCQTLVKTYGPTAIHDVTSPDGKNVVTVTPDMFYVDKKGNFHVQFNAAKDGDVTVRVYSNAKPDGSNTALPLDSPGGQHFESLTVFHAKAGCNNFCVPAPEKFKGCLQIDMDFGNHSPYGYPGPFIAGAVFCPKSCSDHGDDHQCDHGDNSHNDDGCDQGEGDDNSCSHKHGKKDD